MKSLKPRKFLAGLMVGLFLGLVTMAGQRVTKGRSSYELSLGEFQNAYRNRAPIENPVAGTQTEIAECQQTIARIIDLFGAST
jgi:hypothetical protein